MSQKNYWERMRHSRMSRRSLLRASARGGIGVAGIALVGCGDDDDDAAAVAQVEDQAEDQADEATDQAQAEEQADQAAEEAEPEEQAEEPAEEEDAGPAVGATDTERTVRVAIANAVGGLDPQAPGNYTTTFNPTLHFDQLSQYDLETREVVAHLASFEWVEENTATIFHLREGHTWWDGTPLTAEDVKFSIERTSGTAAYNDDGIYDTGIAYITETVTDETTVIDASTLRIPVQSDVTAPSSIGTTMPIVPKAYIEEMGDSGFNQEILGSGVFKLVSFAPDDEVVSVRNDDYSITAEETFNKHRPWIQELRQIVRPEPLARLAALDAGEVDIVTRVEWELVQQYEDRDGFTILADLGAPPHEIFPNTRVDALTDGSPNPFRDIRVRQAMNHAVDVDGMIAALGTGFEQRAYGIGSLQLGGLTRETAPFTFDFNPDKARSLMADAGYPDGFDTEFYGTTGFFALTDQIALTVQQQLEAVGIRTTLQLDPLPDFRARFALGDVPGLHYYFSNQSPDPFQVINAEIAKGGTLAHAEYDELQPLVEAQRTEFDPVKRREALNELAIALYTNASWLFLFEGVDTGVIRDDLEWDMKGVTRDHGSYWAIRPIVT